MKRLYSGSQFGVSTDAISYTQVQLHPDEPIATSLFSVDAQMCCEQPSLILRIQETISVLSQKRHLLHYRPKRNPRNPKYLPVGLFICAHISEKELADLVNPVIRDRPRRENCVSHLFL